MPAMGEGGLTQAMKDEKSRRERVELAAHSLHAMHTKQVYYVCAENTRYKIAGKSAVAAGISRWCGQTQPLFSILSGSKQCKLTCCSPVRASSITCFGAALNTVKTVDSPTKFHTFAHHKLLILLKQTTEYENKCNFIIRKLKDFEMKVSLFFVCDP